MVETKLRLLYLFFCLGIKVGLGQGIRDLEGVVNQFFGFRGFD